MGEQKYLEAVRTGTQEAIQSAVGQWLDANEKELIGAIVTAVERQAPDKDPGAPPGKFTDLQSAGTPASTDPTLNACNTGLAQLATLLCSEVQRLPSPDQYEFNNVMDRLGDLERLPPKERIRSAKEILRRVFEIIEGD